MEAGIRSAEGGYPMKKKLAVVAAVFAALVLFAGCSWISAGEAPEVYPSEVAEERGDDGSAGSWLSSQSFPTTEARRAFEEARADGYTGDFIRFLQETDHWDGGAGAQTALRSVVSVYCLFRRANSSQGFYGIGSGVIYSLGTAAGDAYIVTNYHVVYNADSAGNERISHVSDSIVCYLYGASRSSENEIEATYLGGVMEYDIAVLQVRSSTLLRGNGDTMSAAEVVAADSDSVSAGDRAFAVGNAEGSGISVTEGVVSVPLEYVGLKAADDVNTVTLPEIRTDAAINHGNSGGGLFNEKGELIGITNARLEKTGYLGFGYAIPANFALAVAQNIIDTCAVNAAAHGAAKAEPGISVIRSGSHSVYDAQTGKFYYEERLSVSGVSAEGRSHGFHAGDVLVSATLLSHGKTRSYPLTTTVRFERLLLEARMDDSILFEIYRGSASVTLTVPLSSNTDFLLLT